jgi:uncharacterized protein (TIGR03086 family)
MVTPRLAMSSGDAGGHHGMTVPDLEGAAGRVAALLAGVPDSALDASTPCADTSVAALLDHLMGLSEGLAASARKEPTGAPQASADHLDPDWRTILPGRLDALVAAWRTPGAGEGMTSAGGLTLPAADVAAVTLDELVLHGWDLARATGQPYDPDPTDVAAIMPFLQAFGSDQGVPGLFGPVVPVPDDAPAFDRALGLSGRDPSWDTPAAQGR